MTCQHQKLSVNSNSSINLSIQANLSYDITDDGYQQQRNITLFHFYWKNSSYFRVWNLIQSRSLAYTHHFDELKLENWNVMLSIFPLREQRVVSRESKKSCLNNIQHTLSMTLLCTTVHSNKFHLINSKWTSWNTLRSNIAAHRKIVL